jgi:GTP-binding protein EngB required for normal cell division
MGDLEEMKLELDEDPNKTSPVGPSSSRSDMGSARYNPFEDLRSKIENSPSSGTLSTSPPKSASTSASISVSPRASTSPKRHRSERPPTQKLERQKSDSFTDDAMLIYNEFSKTLNSLQKPTVLLYGLTGTGKSSVLNAVFGSRLAETGEGKPITQNFVKYAPDDFPIVIYDSRGLEHGRSDIFLQETREFLHNLEESSNPMENRIHVVWYVIDLANCRLQDFEGTICRTLFPDLPIIFLLNKCDLVSSNKAVKIQAEIEKLDLKRCYGIFRTAADPDVNSIRFPETCPVCGSDDLVAKRKAKVIICDKGHESPILAQPEGFSDVVKATIRALPKLAQESFVCAQRVSVKQKDLLAKEIIRQHANNVIAGIFNTNLSREMVAMASRLGNLFGFVKYSSVVGQDRKVSPSSSSISFRLLTLLSS